MRIEEQVKAISDAITEAECELEKLGRLRFVSPDPRNSTYELSLVDRIKGLKYAQRTLESVGQLRSVFIEQTNS